jgi:hypothetical protein
MKKQIIATYQKIKLLEIIDLKRKKIIIINNLDNHKINSQTIKKIKEINSEYIVIFLKKPDNKNLFKKKNYRTFNWHIFKDAYKKKYNSHWQSKKSVTRNNLIKKNSIINFLNTFFLTKKDFIEYAVVKENLILLQKKNEFLDACKEIKKYNKNLVIIDLQKNLLQESLQNIKLVLLYFLYPFYSIFFGRFKKKFSHFKIGLRTYNSGVRLNSNREGLVLDWLVKNNSLRKKTLLFLEDKLNYAFRDEIKKKAYETISTRAITPYYSLNYKHLFIFYPKLFFKILINFFNFLLLDMNSKKVAFNGLKNYILWSNISSLVNIKVFMSYHDNEVSSIYRNIILRKKNCETILYKHSHSILLYDEKNYFNVNTSYKFFDREYHWSKLGIAEANRELSKSSKLILSMPFTKILKIKNKINIKKDNHFDVSCFSSGLASATATNNRKEHFLFLNYMHKLLSQNHDIRIMFKPKYKIDSPNIYNHYPEYLQLINKMKKTKRFFIKETVKTKDLILKSSLCITMGFSSPTIEALALFKPSFYVNFQNNYKNNSFKKLNYFYGGNEKASLRIFNYWKNCIINKKNYSKLLNSHYYKLYEEKYYSFEKIFQDITSHIKLTDNLSKK